MTERKRYSNAERKQALRLHRKGWGYNRVADVIGCFPSTVKKWVEAAGQEKHPGPKHPKRKRDDAIGYYKNNGVSVAEAAKHSEVHCVTLARWLREENVEMRVKRISREDVLADISAGMKKKDIAKKYKCSESWIYRIQSGG